ncbi:reductive dehalogenase [Dehalobacter sp. 4CP]|uniref:reductive dehalogenase n=1 Tax=Dehalobacter sp. CP TaxID=2594474 RepID=UPI0039ED5058
MDDHKTSKEKNHSLTRRSFLKGGAFLGSAIGIASLSREKGDKIAEAAMKTQYDDFPVKIAENYKRFSQKNTVFSRGWYEPEIQKLFQNWVRDQENFLDKPGYTQIDKALWKSGWAVEDTFATLSKLGLPQSQCYAWDLPTHPNKYAFSSPQEAAEIVKKATRFLGADLVGIAKYDPRWVYDPLFNALENKDIPAEFPFEPKSVVVIAIEMDYSAYTTAPSYIGAAATGLGYSRMAETAYSVAAFIRHLGYKSFGSGNDVALSIPYAIAAGLGECGRNGILVTYEYGPRVRLCKVFTELEIAPDKPISFGVQEFCKVCKRCADACPSAAIPKDTEPSFEGVCISNNPGIEKWYINQDLCFKYWSEGAVDGCGCCVASCPYNKPELWHHRLTAAITKTPFKPVLRTLDEAFGYGDVFNEDAMREWWKK